MNSTATLHYEELHRHRRFYQNSRSGVSTREASSETMLGEPPLSDGGVDHFPSNTKVSFRKDGFEFEVVPMHIIGGPI